MIDIFWLEEYAKAQSAVYYKQLSHWRKTSFQCFSDNLEPIDARLTMLWGWYWDTRYDESFWGPNAKHLQPGLAVTRTHLSTPEVLALIEETTIEYREIRKPYDFTKQEPK